MDEDVPRRKKPRRKYLDNTNIPEIPAPPLNASYYRIPTPLGLPQVEFGARDRFDTSQTTILDSPFNHANTTRINFESTDIEPGENRSYFLWIHIKKTIFPNIQSYANANASALRSPHEKLLEDLGKVNEHLRQICNDFGTIGEFLWLLFWCKGRTRNRDLREQYHQDVIRRFLQGDTSINIINIIRKIYQHSSSQPSWRSRDPTSERSKAFQLDEDPAKIPYARPAIASFAAQLCAARAHRDLSILTKNDPDHPEDQPARMPLNEVTWDEINAFTPDRAVMTFKRRTPFLYDLFKYLADPRVKGVPMPRKYRPADIRVLVAINALVVGHNRLVNGYLPIHLGVQLFSCQIHTNIKRWLCRMGLASSDKTIRSLIEKLTERDQERLQHSTIEEASRNEVRKCYVLDNCQRNSAVHEGGGVLLKTVMKVGTAATEINLEDCPLDAWNLPDYLSRVSKNLRSTITVDKLWDHVNWSNHHDSQVLYVVKTLVDSIPVLASYSKLISDRFRLPPIAIHHIPEQRQTTIQPLGTNSEREIGFTAGGADETTLEWISGDGATFQTFLNLQKYLAPTALSNRDTLRNKIATPETWHAKDKALKAIAQEHFGPSTCTDPSSLSKLYRLSGFKRPSNLKECDHYPTVRGLEIIWAAQILDCWRIVLGVDELQSYFKELSKKNELLTLEFLLSQGSILVQRYASIGGYERVLSFRRYSELREKELQVKSGTPWDSLSVSNHLEEQMNHGVPGNSMDSEVFDGDRSLANSILFKMQFGSWLLLEYAIKDGDVGTVMQQLTIWTFMFCGSTHQQYVTYLLELHCLLEYESSPALKTAILNNYLVKFGLSCQEKDLMQEHHNGKLELMVDKSGGDFDSPYYRKIISPNVDNFIDSGRVWESALELKHRSNSHTSPSSQPELRVLLMEFKATELHLFRSGRTYPGHIATDLLSIGYNRLGTEGKLEAFIKKTAARSKFISAIEKEKQGLKQPQHEAINTSDETVRQSPLNSNSASPLPPSNTPECSEDESESNAGTERDTETTESSEEVGSDAERIRVEVNIIEGSDEDSQDELGSSDIPGSDDDDKDSSSDEL
ncbi:hypothetical protein K435DRAFT_860767 [Dendrothele bispora CBS 962.96]|uniref:DUF6589 domain-containing protein n=1 Tax=Dendrothele bispora (strain CBS 962.96) TaxID=1314807 RepID=A0A4S8LXQ1_DENBC|nr:hypothetical protein K435DRAFT_860767 [Dendrothele bispora CBS 962.96]